MHLMHPGRDTVRSIFETPISLQRAQKQATFFLHKQLFQVSVVGIYYIEDSQLKLETVETNFSTHQTPE